MSSEDLEFHAVRALAASPRVSQRSLAASLGVSLGRTNYVIRALVEKGFVKAESYRNSGNKLAYLYILTPRGVSAKAAMTRDFFALKVAEFERLQAEIDELRRETGG